MTTRQDTPEEKKAFFWAANNQGFAGTYEEWLALSDVDRAEYELGAAGVPTNHTN